MEGDLQSSPGLDYSLINDDLKYFARLSTILVATIQEVKDRISQIEFIFCSQLFPSFQSRSKTLQKRLAEARKAAEDNWRRKESSLLCQIEELQRGKDHAQEQIQLAVTSLEQEQAKVKTYEQLLCAHESDKKILLAKLESVEKKGEVVQLQEQLRQKTEEMAKGKGLEEKLLQQINLKDQELLAGQNKRKEATTQFLKLKNSFKELKSQYEFLLKRSCLTMENKIPHDRMEEEKNSPMHHQNRQSTAGSKKEATPHKTHEQENDVSFEEKLEDGRGTRSIQNSNFHSNTKPPSTSSSFHVHKCPIKPKAEMSAGQKRPLSYWRETRSRQEPGGADPHDDFLDTPLENARGNMNKVLKEEAQDTKDPALKGMNVDDSDDETQDASTNLPLQKQQISVPVPERKSFKYVEPVRKKAERENLKGVECKQCKKFYDAVLPNEGENNDKNNCNIRCEHHDGVSRHRYRYVPPMTPDGFWNIGFDSDL
eukprot:TRINITY_DN50025_c0_g1_i1.p1 TRINITY_DN50025_c0_g1~~TRINITY_DN50025_c0_g1_i1.p1  ORF type:complete len:483 (+),score=139.71 TRINITY_DN50025_c0_g1_i1:128-1576(+)